MREQTGVNLWKNTAAVISWFNDIADKKLSSFLCFDVVEFYPSISESLLKQALAFASTVTSIEQRDIDIIMHSRRSLLFHNGKSWIKRNKDSNFDVAMGSYDGAEICELVGAFILHRLSRHLPEQNIGLYRDDGLAIMKKCIGPSD